jgi:hypothetical protein
MMQKPLLENFQNDIDILLDHVKTNQFSREILQTQIMNSLTDTYNVLNKLDEYRMENEHLGKFENDRSSVQKYINHYQKQLDQAEEQEDENLKFRYGFSLGVYESFLKDPEKALSLLRLTIASNTLYEIDPDVRVYENFLSKYDPKVLFTTQRNYANKDLFLNLYKRLEGYQITHDKIIKSAGLKIFTFFDVVTKVQKTKLATHVQYLFASLGEDLSLNPKHAGSVKIIGEFEDFVLFDYLSNKKGDLYDFGMEEVFGQMLKNLVLIFKKQGNLTMVHRINNNRKMMEAALLAKLIT